MTISPPKKAKEALGGNEKGLSRLLKVLLNRINPGMGDRLFEKVNGLIIKVFSGKLEKLKEDVEETRKDKNEQKKEGDKVEKKEDNKTPAKKEEKKEEKSKIEKLKEIPDPGKRVEMIARELTKDKNNGDNLNGKHCWDWCAKVYELAGVKLKHKIKKDYFKSYEGKNCGENCANDQELDLMKPGDHIFINNKNKSDTHGNHSVIFLGWKNREKRLAEVASLPWPGRPSKRETRDLFKQPVTFMAGPVNT